MLRALESGRNHSETAPSNDLCGSLTGNCGSIIGWKTSEGKTSMDYPKEGDLLKANVCWDTGQKNTYRIGSGSAFDLAVFTGSVQQSAGR
jgi:hypothetical protein